MICTAVGPTTWADEDTSGGGGGSPGGSDTQVQFNDSNAFGGDAGLTYNKTSNVLSVSDAVAVGTVPATTGPVRLENAAYLTGRNAANNDNLNLIGAGANPSGDPVVIIDPNDWDTWVGGDIHVGFPAGFGIGGGNALYAKAVYVTVTTGGSALGGIGGAASSFGGSVVSFTHQDIGGIQIVGTGTTPGLYLTSNLPFYLIKNGGAVAQKFFHLDASDILALILTGLPTSDPNVADHVYSMDSAGLAAELANGSRYLLVSNGP